MFWIGLTEEMHKGNAISKRIAQEIWNCPINLHRNSQKKKPVDIALKRPDKFPNEKPE